MPTLRSIAASSRCCCAGLPRSHVPWRCRCQCCPSSLWCWCSEANSVPPARVLAVHVWTVLFVALGVASSQYLLHENLTRIALQRTLAGVIVNILLNLLWIPRYGPVGAAWGGVDRICRGKPVSVPEPCFPCMSLADAAGALAIPWTLDVRRLLGSLMHRLFPAFARGRANARILAYGHGQARSIRARRPVDAAGNPLPWYTYPAIEYLSQFDWRGASVFEFGTGYSSRFWAARAARVEAVENDPHWHAELSAHPMPGLTIHLRTEKDAYLACLAERGTQFRPHRRRRPLAARLRTPRTPAPRRRRHHRDG